MIPHIFCNKLKQKNGRQLYVKLSVKQAQERRHFRYVLREKKDLAVVTWTTNIQTKMIFVEGKTCLSG